MELYITVLFWMLVIGAICKVIVVSIAEYPRKEKTSIGFDLVILIKTIGFAVWAGILLWGQ